MKLRLHRRMPAPFPAETAQTRNGDFGEPVPLLRLPLGREEGWLQLQVEKVL